MIDGKAQAEVICNGCAQPFVRAPYQIKGKIKRCGKCRSSRQGSYDRAKGRVCSIAGCERPFHVKGMCSAHYKRERDLGSATAGGTMNGDIQKWVAGLKATETNECVMWPFGCRQEGYGAFRVNGEYEYAHRVMCEYRNGPQPVDKPLAAHSCGNGHIGCVNPRHLRWATPKENAQDMVTHRASGVGRWSNSEVYHV